MPEPSQSPTTGIAFGSPTPKLEKVLSIAGPSQAPLPFMSKYQVPFVKTPTRIPAAVPSQLPTTGITFGSPLPKSGKLRSFGSPSQAPLLKVSKYHVPDVKTPILDACAGN